MIATRTATALAGFLVVGLSTAAGAGTLEPKQAGTFTLADWTASVYYTDGGGNYDVVTTIASPYQDDGVPLRFTAALAPGQTATVAVGGFGSNGDPAVLEIERTGDELSATVVPSDPGIATQ